MALYPKVPIYLFAGSQTQKIMDARDEVLDMLMERESRDEGLTEFTASGNQFGVDMDKVLPEIAGDLATMSFVPGAAKVVVVYNPQILFGSSTRRRAPKKKKKAPSASSRKTKAKPKAKSEPGADFAHWIETELPATGNHLILLAFEDESAGREFNDKHPLAQTIARTGHIQVFRDKKAFFEIEDALLRRDPQTCLGAIAKLWKPGKGDSAVYSAVVRCLRFMLQAKIAQERRIEGDPEKMALYFPARAQFSLFKTSEFVRRKYQRPIPYRATELLEAYRGMLEVYEALRPQPGELFVADARALLERKLMQLFSGTTSRS